MMDIQHYLKTFSTLRSATSRTRWTSATNSAPRTNRSCYKIASNLLDTL
jgi:hypothetical protein